MRTSSGLALTLFLAACDRAPQPASGPVEQAVPEPQRASRLACAQGGAALTPACTLQRTSSEDGEIWTIRFPDGHFRRLRVADGAVNAADGAEVLRADGDDFVLGGDRFQLPDE